MTSRQITRITWLPLAIGLMIGPTIAYEFGIDPEFGRKSVTLHGFPLPWYGDALFGSGPPTDIFVFPALIALALYLPVCYLVWKPAGRRLERARPGVRRAVVGAVWGYAALVALLLCLAFLVMDGDARSWYPTEDYSGLLDIRFGLFD